MPMPHYILPVDISYQVSVQTDVGLSNDDRSYVLGRTKAAIAKLGQTNFGELAGFMKDSMDSRQSLYLGECELEFGKKVCRYFLQLLLLKPFTIQSF